MAKQNKASTKPKVSSQKVKQLPYILIVEDEPTHVAVISHALRSANPNVVVKVARSLQEYRSTIAISLPDIALMDIHLPDGKALEVLTLPPEDGLFPIVVMTIFGDEKIAVKAMKAGALDYVAKSPEAFKAIPRTLERALRDWKLIQERKKAETALKESLNKWNTTFNGIKDPIFLIDTEGIIFQVNESAMKYFGRTEKELVGHHCYEIVHGTSEPILQCPFMRMKQSIQRETTILSIDDTWLELTMDPLKDDEGKLYGAIHSMSDITERKRSEEALHMQLRLQELLMNISTMYINIPLEDVESTIQTSLGELAEFVRADRADIFEYDFQKQVGNNTHEWCGNGIEPTIAQFQEVPMEAVPEWVEKHCRGESIFVPDSSSLPQGAVRDFIEMTNVKTMLAVPLMHLSECIGFVSFDWVKQHHAYSETEQRLLTVFAQMLVNIQQRKLAVKAITRQAVEHETMLSTITEGFWLVDEQGRLLDVNDAYCSMSGYPKEELLHFYIKDIEAAESMEQTGKHIQSIIETGTACFESKHKTKSGRVFDVEINASFWREGKRFFVFIQNISERKRAEEALQKSEERLSSFMNSASDSFYLLDAKLNFVEINKKGLELVGKPKKDIIGKNIADIVPDVKRSGRYEKHLEVLRTGIPFVVEDFIPHPRFGNLHFILKSFRAGDCLGVIASDITELKKAEEAVRQMQKLDGLGTLAGGIAHDFNNILGIIMAYITSMKYHKLDAKKLDMTVDTIVKAIERGKALVQQILTFARKSETEYKSVNVNDVAAEILTMILETFPKVLTYAQKFDKEIPSLHADRSQLHQALLNLCVNARDAMPNGGILSINTCMVSGTSLRTRYPNAVESKYVCIEIGDTGEGMTEEIRKHIFEPFFTTKGIGKGTGLGLAVVFGVVQNHKGFIDVESMPGKGSMFRLYLPASQSTEPVRSKDEETAEDIPGGTETLLVVEDEEALLTFLKTSLVEYGYNILSTDDGISALKIYKERQNEISLVLTDLELPKITGLELCRQIKQLNPKEHVILATGYLDPEMKSESLKAGIQMILFKPYKLKEVLKVVREVLDEK